MATPYIGEIKMVSFNFPPKGWAFCNGQFLGIQQNTALFSLLGTTYGGDGQTTFRLPDLRGASPNGTGQLQGGSSYQLGGAAGQENVSLTLQHLPPHNHFLGAVNRPGTSASPGGKVPAAHRGGYADAPDTTLAPGTLANNGGSQPHPNMPPYLVINFVIALSGVFPSQN